jgi:hypothetical protein
MDAESSCEDPFSKIEGGLQFHFSENAQPSLGLQQLRSLNEFKNNGDQNLLMEEGKFANLKNMN